MFAGVRVKVEQAVMQHFPDLSEEQVRSLLAAEGGKYAPREYFLNRFDISNLRKQLEKERYYKDMDDAASVAKFHKENPEKVGLTLAGSVPLVSLLLCLQCV
jgi:hypothetical protein